ncbi:ammonium transporter [Brevundimonas fluminis]|jgi:hypothetical protein|uniref:ammonium transporter n=1 Tax=Brevundimonas fluminis TaxID=2487274 RepID=UPI0019D02914|nr:ammonium transporter [Brevundimonas fluminis]
MSKEITGSLIWAGGIIGLALAANWALGRGMIDADTSTRIVFVAIGLMIAWYGNRTPKKFVPGARARAANRVAGWSLAISGLIYAASFALLPVDQAILIGCGAIVLGIAVTVGWCLSLRRRATA